MSAKNNAQRSSKDLTCCVCMREAESGKLSPVKTACLRHFASGNWSLSVKDCNFSVSSLNGETGTACSARHTGSKVSRLEFETSLRSKEIQRGRH